MWTHVNYVRDQLLNISPRARLVAYAIASRMGTDSMYRINIDKLMMDTGMSRSAVFRSIDRLIDIFIVRSTARGVYVISPYAERMIRRSFCDESQDKKQ